MKQLVIAILIIALETFTACSSGRSSETKKDTTANISTSDASKSIAAVKYTCTMHPEVISDTSGKCPKCGMEMVPMKDTSVSKMSMDTMKH